MGSIEISSHNAAVANRLEVNSRISDKDFIFKALERRWDNRERAISHYFQTGRNSAELLKTFLADVERVKRRLGQDWQPKSILDFASGYGCVARHLGNVFPGSEISTCDIHEDAVAFNRETLGIGAILSADEPETLEAAVHDVVIALSFFTHMPKSTFARWIKALARAVRPGGVLLFTANGHTTQQLGSRRLVADETGFAFRAASEQHDLNKETYGATISMPHFVFRCLEDCKDVRLHAYREGIWWNNQDTYVLIKEP